MSERTGDVSAASGLPPEDVGDQATLTEETPGTPDGDGLHGLRDTGLIDTSPAPGGESATVETKAKHRRLLYLTLPGCWGALILSCLAFTPSLLPRTGVIQGLVWGITAAIGYGLGVMAAWVARAFTNRDARRPRRRSWRVFFIAGAALLVVCFALGQYWQYEIRKLVGVTEYNVWLVALSPVIAAAMFYLLLLIGRGVRWIYRWMVRTLNRRIGPRAAKATGWIAAAALVYLVISGLLLDGFVNVANAIFSVRNGLTPEEAVQPTSSLRSGGPGSLVSWGSLGRQGKKFVSLGPSAAEIQKVMQQPAMEPIRAYAGLESGKDTESRAELAVADLERAGGFGRKNLLVFTTTGSGWVDPAAVDSFEYLSDGDSAAVAIQYSYLPSWISYLVDQSKARAAGRDLFDAVYDRWSKLPQADRPRLFVGGESLGSFGAETAFSGESDLRIRTAGTLFTGPPNFNTLFREFTDNRDAGTPEIQPVYKNGRTVRFTDNPSAPIPPQNQPWEGSRVLYLMHPSDPIVWWSPHLILSEPDWIAEPPGDDVLKHMVWIPFVTFWQVTADLPFATGVPAGHGHKYTSEYVDSWNAVMQPPGVTAEELTNLRAVIEKGG